MLLFSSRFHGGLVDGSITLTFRAWPTARVKPGGRYRCHPIGVLEVDAVDRVQASDIDEAAARAAGFASRDELLDYLGGLAGAPLAATAPLWRVALHYGGDGDRSEIALDDQLDDDAVAAIAARLAKLDRLSKAGPWTTATLGAIAAQPRIAASKLARGLERETAPFKADVVKLKKLGLTQSFEVGYEISPRGRAYLARCVSRP